MYYTGGLTIYNQLPSFVPSCPHALLPSPWCDFGLDLHSFHTRFKHFKFVCARRYLMVYFTVKNNSLWKLKPILCQTTALACPSAVFFGKVRDLSWEKRKTTREQWRRLPASFPVFVSESNVFCGGILVKVHLQQGSAKQSLRMSVICHKWNQI